MTQMAVVTRRNLTLECFRILGAVFIVFLHVPFPGAFGAVVACLSRFAVPMFFAISGWYSYQVKPGKLLKRTKSVLLLELLGILLYLIWKCLEGSMEGIRISDTLLWKIPDGGALKKWLVFQVDPFSGPLWYLSAAAVCYLVLAVYVRFRKEDYRLFYALSAVLLGCHFAMAELSGYTGLQVEYTVYRNAWFFGIPMFAMGLWLRQYRQKIQWNPLWLLLSGIVLSLWEYHLFGGYDLPLGAVVQAAALLLLAQRYPDLPEKNRLLRNVAPVFGFVSTAVYVLHLIVYDIYATFAAWHLEGKLGNAEDWFAPVLVAGVSILVSVLAYWAKKAWKSCISR